MSGQTIFEILFRMACYRSETEESVIVRLVSFISRSGKSSGELSSVMILNPMVGNSLEAGVIYKDITKMSNNKLFVGNLSFNTTENDLQDAFAAHGSVVTTNLMTDRVTGRARGFGFVTMSSADEAQAAITALNGSQLDGRALTVNEARPREERSGGGRGFGGGERRERY
jgi:RNA recognition motif-containing protein